MSVSDISDHVRGIRGLKHYRLGDEGLNRNNHPLAGSTNHHGEEDQGVQLMVTSYIAGQTPEPGGFSNLWNNREHYDRSNFEELFTGTLRALERMGSNSSQMDFYTGGINNQYPQTTASGIYVGWGADDYYDMMRSELFFENQMYTGKMRFDYNGSLVPITWNIDLDALTVTGAPYLLGGIVGRSLGILKGIGKWINSGNWLRIGMGWKEGTRGFRIAWGATDDYLIKMKPGFWKNVNIELRKIGGGHADIWFPK